MQVLCGASVSELVVEVECGVDELAAEEEVDVVQHLLQREAVVAVLVTGHQQVVRLLARIASVARVDVTLSNKCNLK